MQPLYLDGRWQGPHGIGRYAAEVTPGLKKLATRVLTGSGRVLGGAGLVKLNSFCAGRRGLFYSPGFMAPIAFRGDFLITVHDLIHVYYREEQSKAKHFYYSWLQKHLMHQPAVFTVSEYSKKEIIEWCGIDECKVKVHYNGISDVFHPSESKQEKKNEEPYLAMIGSDRAHKNIEGVISAFAKARVPSDIALKVTGKPSDYQKELVSSLHLEDRVSWVGFLTERELADFYSSARAFLFPSFYEGFGLPPLEALACGTPVYSSDSTCMPEILGELASYFEPTDQSAIVSAIEIAAIDESRIADNVREGLFAKYNWSFTEQGVRSDVEAVLKQGAIS